MFFFPRTRRGAERMASAIDHVWDGKLCGDDERRLLALLLEYPTSDAETDVAA